MKYIRTKNEIYETIESIGHTIFPSQYQNRYMGMSIIMDEAIKEANTIEELFDEYVWDKSLIKFINKEKTKFILKQANAEYEEEYDIEEDLDEFSAPIYGAIWTDKGLTYVAKMKGILPNGEKDWELL